MSSNVSCLPDRNVVLGRLREVLPERNLYDLAHAFLVPIECKGGINKGWVGQTIERAAGLGVSTLASRDGLDFELKTTSFLLRDGRWFPKETIKVTQLNPKAILEEEFLSSALWMKLCRLILVGCHHESETVCRAVYIGAIDIENPEWVEPIRAFWEDVRDAILSGNIMELNNLGSSQSLVQLRPTGDGKQSSLCPITGEKFPARSFYATKKLIERMLAPHKAI